MGIGYGLQQYFSYIVAVSCNWWWNLKHSEKTIHLS